MNSIAFVAFCPLSSRNAAKNNPSSQSAFHGSGHAAARSLTSGRRCSMVEVSESCVQCSLPPSRSSTV
jgi:hypothetical protein